MCCVYGWMALIAAISGPFQFEMHSSEFNCFWNVLNSWVLIIECLIFKKTTYSVLFRLSLALTKIYNCECFVDFNFTKPRLRCRTLSCSLSFPLYRCIYKQSQFPTSFISYRCPHTTRHLNSLKICGAARRATKLEAMFRLFNCTKVHVIMPLATNEMYWVIFVFRCSFSSKILQFEHRNCAAADICVIRFVSICDTVNSEPFAAAQVLISTKCKTEQKKSYFAVRCVRHAYSIELNWIETKVCVFAASCIRSLSFFRSFFCAFKPRCVSSFLLLISFLFVYRIFVYRKCSFSCCTFSSCCS